MEYFLFTKVNYIAGHTGELGSVGKKPEFGSQDSQRREKKFIFGKGLYMKDPEQIITLGKEVAEIKRELRQYLGFAT